MDGVVAGFVVIGVVATVLGAVFWFLYCLIDQERLPWQHKQRCPCGKCFARRMREAVERAEYERQQEEIRNAVREVNRR